MKTKETFNFWEWLKGRKKCRHLLWFIIGAGLSAVIVLLLSNRGHCQPDVPPDTTTLIIVDTVPGVDTVFLPKGSGQAVPTVDSFYQVPYFKWIPNWRINSLDYRNRTLKLAALRVLEDDTLTCEAYSATYFCPGGFHLEVWGDSIRVDTFPEEVSVKPEAKPKIFWWSFKGGAGLSAQDSTLKLRPLASAGCLLGPLRIKKTELFWEIARINWIIGAEADISTAVEVRF